MKWKKLKEFCNSLDELQLEKKVILWREEEAIINMDAEILADDYYIGNGEDGCYTLSDAGFSVEDIEEKGLKIAYEKGNPILCEEF